MSGINPMHQFELSNVVEIEAFGYNFSLTNGAISMFVAIGCAILMALGLRKHNKMIPNRLQSALEMIIGTLKNAVGGILGEEGEKYVPYVFSVFLFVLTLNLLGLIPGSFAETSHISMTFALALTMFFTCLMISIGKHGIKFLKIFIPAGTPWWLAPLMFVLEFFSYCIRPVSIAIRLAANMIAGHVMLDVIAFFVIMMGVFGVLPLAFLMILMAFEAFVAILQAYIFSIFTSVYISESIEG